MFRNTNFIFSYVFIQTHIFVYGTRVRMTQEWSRIYFKVIWVLETTSYNLKSPMLGPKTWFSLWKSEHLGEPLHHPLVWKYWGIKHSDELGTWKCWSTNPSSHSGTWKYWRPKRFHNVWSRAYWKTTHVDDRTQHLKELWPWKYRKTNHSDDLSHTMWTWKYWERHHSENLWY